MYTTTRFDRLKKLKVADASAPQSRASAGYLKPLKQWIAEREQIEEVIVVPPPTRPIIVLPEPPPPVENIGYIQSGYIEDGYIMSPIVSFTILRTDFNIVGTGEGMTSTSTGFTCSGTHPGGREVYNADDFGSKIDDISLYFLDKGLLTDYSSYIFNVTWGPGSSITSGKVLLATAGTQVLLSPVYTGDNNWQTSGQNIYTEGPMNLAGTFNFPATFSLYTPVIENSSQWC